MDTPNIDKVPRFLVMAACLIVIIAGLRGATSIIVPVLISVLIAVISLPLQNWLMVRKVPRSIAVFLTLIADVLILVGFGFLIGGSLQGFADEWPKYQARFRGMIEPLTAWLNAQGYNIASEDITKEFNPRVALNIVNEAFRQVAFLVSNFILVFLTILFVLSEAAGFSTKLERALGHSIRTMVRVDNIKKDIQQYLIVKTAISLTTGVLVGVSLALIGLDFPILWGLLAFLLNYIPSFGSIIAAIPPILLSLIQFGFSGRALGVAVLFIFVNLLLGSLIEPLLMGRRLGLSVLVVFLSLLFWGWVWGPFGMILSVPLTMIIKIMLENSKDLRWIAVMLGTGKE